MKEDVSTALANHDDGGTIADLQSRLRDAQAEVERMSMQRDHLLRLLRQQQTITAADVQNKALAFYREQNTILARIARGAPRKIKDIIPAPIKQALKQIIIKIG